MKKMLMRPTSALLPIALLACALMGYGREMAQLAAAYLLLQLCSLCAADCFRNAAAREPSVRRVDRRFGGALVQLALGAALAYLAVERFPCLPCAEGTEGVALAALLICIEQMFEERMLALSRPMDCALLSGISAALLFTGVMVDGGGAFSAPFEGFFTFAGAGLGALISLIAGYAVEPPHGFSLVPANYGRAAVALVQTLLYPALALAAAAFAPRAWGLNALEPLLAGWILWRLARTTCRRAADESRLLNLMLVVVAGALAVAAQFAPMLLPYGGAAALAMVCAAAVFCAPSLRLGFGILLAAAAWVLALLAPLPQMWNRCAGGICALAAVALNLKRAFLRRV